MGVPKVLPADFTGFDEGGPPASLPADFAGFDAARTPPLQAETAIDRVIGLHTTPPAAPPRPRLTIGPAPRTTAEGLVSEQAERAGAAPLRPTLQRAPLFTPPETKFLPAAPQVSLARPAEAAPVRMRAVPLIAGEYPETAPTGDFAEAMRQAGTAVRTIGAPMEKGKRALQEYIGSEAASLDPEATTTPRLARAYQSIIAPAAEEATGFLGGMVDPVNLALMGALSALPAVTSAQRALHAATRAYFAGTMGIGGLQRAYQAYEAAQKGNIPDAVRNAFGAVLNLGFAGGMVLGPGKGYTPLPNEPPARATELFRNLIYKAGGDLRPGFTPEEASAAFRRAQTNLRDPANQARDLDLSKDLSAAYADYNQHVRLNQAEAAVNTFLPSIAGTPEARAAAAAAVTPPAEPARAVRAAEIRPTPTVAPPVEVPRETPAPSAAAPQPALVPQQPTLKSPSEAAMEVIRQAGLVGRHVVPSDPGSPIMVEHPDDYQEGRGLQVTLRPEEITSPNQVKLALAKKIREVMQARGPAASPQPPAAPALSAPERGAAIESPAMAPEKGAGDKGAQPKQQTPAGAKLKWLQVQSIATPAERQELVRLIESPASSNDLKRQFGISRAKAQVLIQRFDVEQRRRKYTVELEPEPELSVKEQATLRSTASRLVEELKRERPDLVPYVDKLLEEEPYDSAQQAPADYREQLEAWAEHDLRDEEQEAERKREEEREEELEPYKEAARLRNPFTREGYFSRDQYEEEITRIAEDNRRDHPEGPPSESDPIKYMDEEQEEAEALLRSEGIKFNADRASYGYAGSRYITVYDANDDPIGTVRIADHPQPRLEGRRGGFHRAGGFNLEEGERHDASEVSIAPGDDSIDDLREWLEENGLTKKAPQSAAETEVSRAPVGSLKSGAQGTTERGQRSLTPQAQKSSRLSTPPSAARTAAETAPPSPEVTPSLVTAPATATKPPGQTPALRAALDHAGTDDPAEALKILRDERKFLVRERRDTAEVDGYIRAVEQTVEALKAEKPQAAPTRLEGAVPEKPAKAEARKRLEKKAAAKGAETQPAAAIPPGPGAETAAGKSGLPSEVPQAAPTRKAIKRTDLDIIREAYRPGAVVTGYAGRHDKVLSFREDPKLLGGWVVEVQESDAQGNVAPGTTVRTHATMPSKAELSAARKRLEGAVPEEPAKAEARKRLEKKAAARKRLEGAVPEKPAKAEARKRLEKKAAAEEAKTQPAAVPEITPKPGKVGVMPTKEIAVNANRFQFKLDTDVEGTSTLLKEQTKFNPDLAGVITVWRDPADGKVYVVNGHHRLELAKRTGMPEVAVRSIPATNAARARAVGALQNIAEGRGTPLDAAKFLRDSGISPDQLKAEGVPMGEATARDGVALSKLDEGIFQDVVAGRIPLGRAVAIGEATDNLAEQRAIVDLVESKEAKGGRVNNQTLRELIRLVKSSGTVAETNANLFGEQQIEKSLALEKADVSAYVKQQLAKDKRLFGFVSKGNRPAELSRGGNVIDVEASHKIAIRAAQGEELYNKLSERAGAIASVLDGAARRIAVGDDVSAVKREAYEAIHAEMGKVISGWEKGSVADREVPPDRTKHYQANARRGELNWGGSGLTEDQAQTWAKSKSLDIAEAGEQETIFGPPERMYRFTRTDADGLPERALVSESQIVRMVREGNAPVVKALNRARLPIPGEQQVWEQGLENFLRSNFATAKAFKKAPADRTAKDERLLNSESYRWERMVELAIERGEQVPDAVWKEFHDRTNVAEQDTLDLEKPEEPKAQRELFAKGEEPTTMGLTVPGAAQAANVARTAYEKEILPALDKTKLNLKQALTALQHLIAPRAGVPIPALDAIMQRTGEREECAFHLEQVLSGAERMFDSMPREQQVAFIDRRKGGEAQPTPELNEIQNFIDRSDEETYRRVVEAQVGNLSAPAQGLWAAMPEGVKTAFLHRIAQFKAGETIKPGPLQELADGLLAYKHNHYRVLWRVIPGIKRRRWVPAIADRRPLEGSRGFLWESTLDTMSEGLEAGGEPASYNPLTMFRMAQADAWRYITAQEMWQDAKAQGARVFVRHGHPTPEGFTNIEDRIGDVRFPAASGEGMVEAGRWCLRDDWARLMNNYLSHDYWRENIVGRGLMAAKNQLTAYRLGFSPFHAFTETASSIGSQLAHGATTAVNLGLRHGNLPALGKGVVEALKAPLAPVLDVRRGTSAIRYLANREEFLKTTRGLDFERAYPEAARLIDDLFSSGAKLKLHEDERLKALEGLRRAAADDRYIAALLKLPFALNQLLQKPLFNYYIPRMKVGMYLRDFSRELVDRQADIEAAEMTRGQLGRKTWDAIEDQMGQLNWDARFWNRTFKAAVQFAFRSFTWFVGNIRLADKALEGQARELLESLKVWNQHFNPSTEYQPLPSSTVIPRLDPNLAKIIGLFAVFAGTNALIQYAATREGPHDWKDLFAGRIGGKDSRGKPLRVTAPAIIFNDWLSLRYRGLGAYLAAKKSDVLQGMDDVLRNEDFRRVMIHNPEDSFWKQRYDDAKHVLGLPIGVGTYLRERQAGETGPKAALGLAGFKPPPATFDMTRAERAMSEINNRKQGLRTQEEIDELQAAHERIRLGVMTPEERRQAIRNLRKPWADRQFQKLTYTDMMRVYTELANGDEKARWRRLLVERRHNLLKRGERQKVAGAEAAR